ncbi:hypothetical protein ABIF97_004053 [Bradyrhizobium japonicum]
MKSSITGLVLPHRSPMCHRETADAILNGVEHRDPLQRFRCSASSSQHERPRTFAAHAEQNVSCTSLATVLEQALVGGIAVDLQEAVVVPEQLLGGDRLAILGKYEDDRRRRQEAHGRSFSGNRLELADFGPTTAGIENRQRRLVGKQPRVGHHGLAQQRVKGLQPPAGVAHPRGQRLPQ